MDFVFSDFQIQRPAMVQLLLLQLLLLCCVVEVFGSSLLNRHREHLKWFWPMVEQFLESYSLWNQKAICPVLSMLKLWVCHWFQSFPHSQFLFGAQKRNQSNQKRRLSQSVQSWLCNERFLWRRSKLCMCLFHPCLLSQRSEIIFFIFNSYLKNDISFISWYYLQFITIFVSVEFEFKCFEFASVRNSCTINFIFWLLWFNFWFFQKDVTLIYFRKWVINRCWIVIWQKIWHKNTKNKIIGKFVYFNEQAVIRRTVLLKCFKLLNK